MGENSVSFAWKTLDCIVGANVDFWRISRVASPIAAHSAQRSAAQFARQMQTDKAQHKHPTTVIELRKWLCCDTN